MKNRWLKIVLVASLALNLAFISAVVFKRHLGRNTSVPEDINLQPGLNLQLDQKQKLDTIINKFRLQLVQYKQEILEKRIEIIEELSDPECDFDQLSIKTQALNQFEKLMNTSFVETLIEINNLLDARQRLSFLLSLSKNWFFIHESPSGD
ncbi:MAG: periplasmic heavy metal sensor [Candidatus Aminicenantes bacterium]|nr:periplasmic heavy metal sensor [Candidatus Aminicenantes bacterium]